MDISTAGKNHKHLLSLLYSEQVDKLDEIAGQVANFMVIYNKLNYYFSLTPMPVVKIEIEETERSYKGAFKKEKKVKEKKAVYYLEFSRELTNEELTLWRMFKIGYLCCYCKPIGHGIW